jgi:hypothetical protein
MKNMLYLKFALIDIIMKRIKKTESVINNSSEPVTVPEAILKAKYDYRSGNILFVPKQGLAPVLFLEFIQQYGRVIIHIPVASSSYENRYFKIRMPSELREAFYEARDYINSNLPSD